MAKAKQLPSGSWRVRVYSYTDKDGKKHYESFTASTKTQAEQMASQFANTADRMRAGDITVKQAIANYIDANKDVLSPSTILNYSKDAKRFEMIDNIKIRKLTSNDVQRFINYLSVKKLSPKTIKNTYGLLRSSLTFAGLDNKFMIHLPKAEKKQKFAPESEQIMALFNNASHEMKIAIALASHHSLRRGEISALKFKDLTGNCLRVHSDVVSGLDGWVHKDIPKTETSNRVVYLSGEEVALILNDQEHNQEDYIVPLTPGAIGMKFHRLKKSLGLEEIRFHDLRVYFASISAALGIPETVTAHHGGWREGSAVLRDHYRKPIASIDEGYANKMNEYFAKMARD